tara:strand:+ start:297 stop:1103 length:807 start_codon:yes stop_codon:yes gene_type:complete
MEGRYQSGSPLWDDFLEGGFEQGCISVLFGPYSSGKTCLALVALSALPEGKKAIWIDTEGSFSLDRFKQLCPQYKEILEHTIFFNPVTFEEQESAIMNCEKICKEEEIELIVVDSMSMLYRVSSTSTEDAKVLNDSFVRQLRQLVKLARSYTLPVLITSQVYADITTKESVKVVGGLMIKNIGKCLIELRKEEKIRKAEIVKHRSIEEGHSIEYQIVREGISLPVVEEDIHSDKNIIEEDLKKAGERKDILSTRKKEFIPRQKLQEAE